MRRCVLGLGLSLSLSLSVDGQLIGGAGSMGGDACSMATFTARTDEVDGVCCNAANSAADRCVAGVPQRCDSACATVFIPWYTECEEIITTIVRVHIFCCTYLIRVHCLYVHHIFKVLRTACRVRF